MYNNTQRIGV